MYWTEYSLFLMHDNDCFIVSAISMQSQSSIETSSQTVSFFIICLHLILFDVQSNLTVKVIFMVGPNSEVS